MIAPYVSWKSPITSSLIVSQSIGISDVRIDRGEVYWLESRPQERGRAVVVRAGVDLTPAPFNVRTRVHEYGGGAWNVAGGHLYFSNDADGRLYRDGQPITAEGAFRYADGIVDAGRNRWIGVREDHSSTGEAVNAIVAIALDSGKTEVIAAGHDFFSTPRLSPDGRRLAYLAWDHPNMPWDGTQLYVDSELVAGGPDESIFQPEWSPDGVLHYVSDRTGWWNLYREGQPLAPMNAEFGLPQWIFGMSTYAFAGPGRVVCSYIQDGLSHLAVLDGALTPIDTPYTDISSLRAEGDVVVFRGAAPHLPASIVRLDLRTGATDVLKKATTVADDPEISRYFTRVEPVEHALFYPAFNPDYSAPPDEKPPLLVKVHGGPTASASSGLDLRIQYWTSRGISVVDVNYGGSTGYGRAYRERLNGNWGVVDVDDSVEAARRLAQAGRVDPNRCVITGGSAGGYTVLAALAFRDFFAGGASHYGVSDCAALAQDTHKFESRYLDKLLGAEDRSPIHAADRIRVPVIFFQGDEDRVVPPNQTETMVDALRRNGTPVAYFLFAGEQHGFRQSANIQRALDAELYFYATNIFRAGLYF